MTLSFLLGAALRAGAPVVEAAASVRWRLGGSDNLAQRLVAAAPPAPAAIWVHGASVGELTSARVVIEALAHDHRVLVTTNSTAGRDMVARWGQPARLAPLDVPGALARFLDAVQPRLALSVEAEIWPLRSAMLARRGVRQAVIGARMSERSGRRWARLPGIIGPILSRIDALSAQDGDSEARLSALGVRPEAILPRLDLKLIAPARAGLPPDDPARGCTILAASTHEGEDEVVLAAWSRLRRAHPDLRLIMAPRHPARGDAVAAQIAAAGFAPGRRSGGDDRVPPGGILLADTLGEMDRWYAAAGITIVCGSFADRGGHTPWEPAAHGSAIVTGPHVGNFVESYRALDAARAAIRSAPDRLAADLDALLRDPGAARAMAQRAHDVLRRRAGDPDALIAHLAGLARPTRSPDMNL